MMIMTSLQVGCAFEMLWDGEEMFDSDLRTIQNIAGPVASAPTPQVTVSRILEAMIVIVILMVNINSASDVTSLIIFMTDDM